MQITTLTEADMPGLAELYKAYWNEESNVERMREVFQRIDANPAYLLMGARIGNQLAGSAMGIVCDELYGECHPFMVIEDMVVGSEFRRQGVGSAIMREMERLAVERGCRYIIFVTESNRTGAHQFYASIGYDPDGFKGFKKKLTLVH